MSALHFPERIEVMDSHTEGEPTRVVIGGWPELRSADMAGRRQELLVEWDHLRSAVVCEPRGHDALVGALLTPAVNDDSATGVVFFNNVGTLGMCGHGLIGVIRTLEYMGRVEAGAVRIDTPAGTVTGWLNDDSSVTIRNVPAYCHALDVEVHVPGVGVVRGDIAYGGNWFFIAHVDEPIRLDRLDDLSRSSAAIMRALKEQDVRGADGAVIDHVELSAPTDDDDCDRVNFVLCPGGAYDRSPCGTGTSAALAVLHARGRLGAHQVWRQRSVTGGRFEAWLEPHEGTLYPHIRGRAWITGRTELRFDAGDPFRRGFTGAA